MSNSIWRTLVELAILFIMTTVFRLIQPYLGLSFAVIISLISPNKNKYTLINIILSLYIIIIWIIIFNPSNLKFIIASWSLWVGIFFFALVLWVNENLEVIE